MVKTVGPGTVLFDKYRVDYALGRGGMSIVLAATHINLGDRVAIKILLEEMLESPNVVERFLREAQAAARLKGEHVARVTDVGMMPWGVPYMVMEFLDGVDLHRVLKDRGYLPAPETVDYILQACEAMAEAHALGIVHRDIKPANFFITQRPDGSPLLKVLDFGISKVAENEVTDLTHDAVIGTPSYMSPEQLRESRDADARSDIWSLGIVLYEAVSGQRPFQCESFSGLAIKVATEATPLLPAELPPGLDAVIYRCLEKPAARRFQSVADLAVALAPFAGNRRAAANVVEATSAILHVTPRRFPSQMTVPESAAAITTLGSSAGAIVKHSERSRLPWIVGGGVLVAIPAIVLALTLGGRGHDATTPAPAAEPAAIRATAPSPAPVATPVAPASPVAPAPPPVAAAPAATEPAAIPTVEPPADPTATNEPAEPAEPTASKAVATRPGKKKTPRLATRKASSKAEQKSPQAATSPSTDLEPLPPPPPAPPPRPNPLETRM
jgi:serine/threonine-protein kinase